MNAYEIIEQANYDIDHNIITFGEWEKRIEPTKNVKPIVELKEEFQREIETANKDIDLMPEQEEYMRGYLGGILCAYRIVFGKNYEEKTE